MLLVTLIDLLPFIDIRWLKVMRALRPIRLISKSKAMKVVVKSLARAVPSIVQVMLILLLFLVIFAVVGVQFWAGAGYGCFFDQVLSGAEATRAACEASGGRWRRASNWSFDNIGTSLLVLFEVSTLEQWPTIMYTVVDMVGPDRASERDHNPYAVLFFICFILFCILVLNLFVGVVVDNYYAAKSVYDGSVLLTREQRDWVAVQRVLLKHRLDAGAGARLAPPVTESRARAAAFAIVSSPTFEATMSAIVLLNFVVIAADYYGSNRAYELIFSTFELVFLAAFVVEAALAVYALGPRQYFGEPWNFLDVIVILVGVISLTVPRFRIVRALRAFRLLKLLRRVPSLNYMFVSMRHSLPALRNVGSILVLVFFIYAIAGVALFSGIGNDGEGRFITNNANFRNCGQALLLLFRAMTGESWNGIMHELSRSGQVNQAVPILYFVSFCVTMIFILTNLVVAVVMESFADLLDADGRLKLVRGKDVALFNKVWVRYDPGYTYYLPIASVIKVIAMMIIIIKIICR